MLEHLRFGGGVHRGSRFVEHQNICLRSHEGSGQGDLLPLPTREFLAVFEPPAKLGLETGRQFVNDGGRHAHIGRLAPA